MQQRNKSDAWVLVIKGRETFGDIVVWRRRLFIRHNQLKGTDAFIIVASFVHVYDMFVSMRLYVCECVIVHMHVNSMAA